MKRLDQPGGYPRRDVMGRNALGRRAFLGGVAAAAAAAPFVPWSVGRAGSEVPTRFLVFWTPNGLHDSEWKPGESFALRRILAPASEFRDRLLFLDNLDWQSYFDDPSSPANDHPPPISHCLCATDVADYTPGAPGVGNALGGGPSIDQFIASQIGGSTRFRSLVLSAESGAARSGLCYRAAREAVPPISDPVMAFDRVFGDVVGSTGEPDAAAVRLRAERRSVIDLVRSELSTMEAQVGVDDKFKIEAHLTHLRSLEQRLGEEVVTRSCAAPDLTAHMAETEYARFGRQHMDIITMALACDLTRVAFLEWDGARTVHRWLDGVSEPHHTYSHYNAGLSTDQNEERLVRIGEWYGEQFAYLLRALDSVPEGDGTLLDHTVVLWTSEHKASGGSHNRRDVPHLIAGGGGYFRTGQMVDCGGRAHNDLHVSICHAMGLTDVTTFGNARVCEGPLSGVT